LIAMLNSAWSQSNLLGLGNFEEPKGDWFEAGGAKLNESDGEKIKNAVFKKVELNGTTVHKNVEVTGPTASSLDEKEEPFGPLMLQGDHGPVAYRKIVLKKR